MRIQEQAAYAPGQAAGVGAQPDDDEPFDMDLVRNLRVAEWIGREGPRLQIQREFGNFINTFMGTDPSEEDEDAAPVYREKIIQM